MVRNWCQVTAHVKFCSQKTGSDFFSNQISTDWFSPLFPTESLFNRRAARRKNRIGLPLGSDRTAVQAFPDRVWALLATRLSSCRMTVAYAFASPGAAEICAKKRVELQRPVSQGVVKQAQNSRI